MIASLTAGELASLLETRRDEAGAAAQKAETQAATGAAAAWPYVRAVGGNHRHTAGTPPTHVGPEKCVHESHVAGVFVRKVFSG